MNFAHAGDEEGGGWQHGWIVVKLEDNNWTIVSAISITLESVGFNLGAVKSKNEQQGFFKEIRFVRALCG